MKKTLTLSFLLLFSTLYLSSCSCKKKDPEPNGNTETTITLNSAETIEDAYITDYYPTTNYATGTKIFMTAWTFSGDAANTSFLIKFDYSSIPSGKTVKSAKLSFWSDTTNIFTGSPDPEIGHYGTNLNWTLRRVTSSWTEAAVTYGTKPTSVETNKIQLTGPATSTSSYLNIDVTQLVKDQIASNNYGFEASLDALTPYKRIPFYSSDAPYTARLPKLVLELE